MAWLLIDFILLGLAGGLLGIFYRNCLKGPNMIFNFIYYDYLKKWAELKEDLEEAFEDCDVMCYRGDQPVYHYILSVE